MKNFLARLGWLTLGALLVLIALECILRFLPVSMGLYRTDQSSLWPLQSYEPNRPYAYSISWSLQNAHRGTTNNYGHIAPFDYKPASHPVVVIGDSFIEALMNKHADTLQGQLGQKMGGPDSVYGLGVSGLSASDYVALSKLARDEFKPAAAVFLMIDGDLSESLGTHLGYHYLVPDGESLKPGYLPLQADSAMKAVRKAIGDISLYRYLQVHLQFSPGQIFKVFQDSAPPATAAGLPAKKINGQKKVADWMLAELPAALALPPECIVFLMDSDRYAIYKPDLATPRKDSPQARAYFIEQATQRGFKVSDLDLVFRRQYAHDGAKFDYWPIDRHWNRHGHGMGAQEAERLLFAPPQSTQPPCLTRKPTGG